MSEPQLDLVMLTVTPDEARLIATALSIRASHYGWSGDDNKSFDVNQRLSEAYTALRRKVEYQSGASDHP